MAYKPTEANLRKIRSQLEAAQTELDQIPDRLLPHNEAIGRAEKWVDAQAEAFNGDYKATAFSVTDNASGINALLSLKPNPIDGAIDTAPLIAWLLPDQLKQRLAEAIEARPEPANALAQSDRGPMAEKLRNEIARLEIEEELMIRALEDSGELVGRRPDADLSVVLAPTAELNGEPQMDEAA